MGPFGFGGITAFHGSPHKFDAFDMKKVGTGEGAQAYGHGLYFAENPGVARSYSNVGQPAWKGQTTYGHVQTALETAKANGLSGLEAKKFALSYLNDRAKSAPDFARQQFYDAANNFDELAKGGAGNLYKVDIPDDQVAKMLDWDKPLSQQPEIFKKINKGIKEGEGRWFGSITGASLHTGLRNKALTYDGNPVNEIFRKLGKGANQDEAVRLYLNSIGIPGIRYLDQGSRSGGKGTSNFVVFDDQIPKIIGRE
jgi:hypothetical protein